MATQTLTLRDRITTGASNTSNARAMTESPVTRGVDEEFAYAWALDRWPTGAYTNEAVTLAEEDGTDITAAALTGSAVEATGTLTTPKFVAGQLTAGEKYKLEWTIDIDSDNFSGFLWIRAQS